MKSENYLSETAAFPHWKTEFVLLEKKEVL